MTKADFSRKQENLSKGVPQSKSKFMTQSAIADLVNCGVALQDRERINKAPVQKSDRFDFSTAGLNFTTINETWTSDSQNNQIMIAFDVQLVAAVSPYYKKYVRIRPKTTSFFKPTRQRYASMTDKGYYQDQCEIGIGYYDGGNGFELEAKAPNNPNGASKIATSTQFGVSSNVGASMDGPNAGVGVHYSQGTIEEKTVSDFSVYAEKYPYIDVILPESKYIYDIDVWNDPTWPTYLKDYYVFVSDEPFKSKIGTKMRVFQQQQKTLNHFISLSPDSKHFPA